MPTLKQPLKQRKGALISTPRLSPRRKAHYVSAKLSRRIRPEKGGYGVFANQTLQTGELLVVWGGDIVTGDLLVTLSPVQQRHSVQVEENLYLVPHEMPEVGDFINHSCAPNAGLSGQSALVARHVIHAGEEICYDYAMSDGSPYDEFDCTCSTPDCRGRITGNDWMIADLQERYLTYFSPYLQRRIERHHEQRSQRPLAAVPGLFAKID